MHSHLYCSARASSASERGRIAVARSWKRVNETELVLGHTNHYIDFEYVYDIYTYIYTSMNTEVGRDSREMVGREGLTLVFCICLECPKLVPQHVKLQSAVGVMFGREECSQLGLDGRLLFE